MSKKNFSVIVSGCYVWDKITQREYVNGYADQKSYVDRIVSDEPGGTAGNVACLMAYYGWNSYPQGHFDTSRYGWALTRGLKAWGCDVRFIENSPLGKVSIYHEDRKLDKEGNRKVTKYTRGGWGSMFGAHKYLRAKDEVPQFVEVLDFVPDVFFFDAPEAGNAALGETLREKGSLVYFEPEVIKGNAETMKKVMRRVSSCDVMKFSRVSLPDVSFCDGYKDKLFIQTLDSEGVRFKLRDGEWITIPAVYNPDAIDALGAGDTTTAAFLNALANMDMLSMDRMTEKGVRTALAFAMEEASKSVGYEGAKGYYWHLLGDKAESHRITPGFDQLGEGLGKEYKGKILYFHGSASCGNSRTPGLLAAVMPEYEIIAPDTPHDPVEAVEYFKRLCDEIRPDLIIGSSMGAFYAQKMIGWKRICCNPALHMSNDEDMAVGRHGYAQRVDRLDGSRSYLITKEIQDRFREMEAHQLENIPEEDKDICWGIFCDNDTVVTDDSRKEFISVYPHWMEYHGEHGLHKENVEEFVAPLARKMIGR